MRAMRRLWGCVGTLTVVLAAAETGLAQSRSNEPKNDSAAIERALGQSVGRVSRPAQPFALGFDDVRVFRLEGYGVLFVLSPRHLPGGAPGQRGVIHRFRFGGEPVTDFDPSRRILEDAIKNAPSEEVKAQLQSNLRALERLQKGAAAQTGAISPEAEARTRRELKRLQEVIETFRSESEREWARAERNLAEALAVANRRPEGAAPHPAEAPLIEFSEATPSPPAPWAVWFEIEESDEASPEETVQNVRTAVTRVLESAPAVLHALRPDEFVAVAVDFLPRDTFVEAPRPRKSLVIRVRKRDLDDRRTGQISVESLRSRIEVLER
jgi:hypothetical protein